MRRSVPFDAWMVEHSGVPFVSIEVTPHYDLVGIGLFGS